MSIPFVIVGAPRTGTTLLVRTLGSIDGICCHGELLNESAVLGLVDGFEPLQSSRADREERARRLLAERDSDPPGFIQATLAAGERAAGFKALYGALLNPRWGNVLQHIATLPGVRFIHVARDNGLRRYVSERLMWEGGPNHSALGGGSERRAVIEVDIDSFIRQQDALAQQASRVETLLQELPVHRVRYEALAADVPGSVTGICRFLGVDITSSQVEPALQKVGATDLREVVSNVDELLADPRTSTLVQAE